MALVLKDRVKETSNTAGTGTITLAGAVAGFQSFSAVGNGNTTYYAIVDPTTGDWEVGIGTYTSSGTTLSRDTVLSSSNSGSLVSFAANQKDVFVTYPSEKSVYEDASNVVNATSFGAITATSAALTTGTVSTAPASGTDIANKTYVDTLVSSGITYHTPVKYEVPDSTGNLNATYNQPGGPGVGVGATLTNAGTLVAFTPDGTVATAGDRIIVYNQTNQFENGIYTVTTVGSGSVAWVLTRATDADTYALKSPNGLGNGDAFFITSGATGAGETYVCNTAGTITFGTTAITFAQISDSTLYTAGTGLTLTGTEFSITPTGTAGTYGSASSVPVLTTNASGQVTSVTNTTIAINGSQVSGNISGSAGSVANALTLGTYLTGGTYNGSAAVTATVDATSANTASKVVARDSSGNFSAGTITATLSGSATSATTATNIAGGAANQIAYQSAANTTAFATAPSASNQVLNWNGSAFTWSAGTISGVPLGSNLNSLTAGTYLTGTAYNGSAAQTWTVDATSANTASKVVARDASGNFSASTITAALSGNATTATSATNATNLTGGTLSSSGGTITGGLGIAGSYTTYNAQPLTLGNDASYAYIQSWGGRVLWLNPQGNNIIAGTGGNTVLTGGNYNSYAPTLTGTGASGTWNINVTGSAGSASSVAWGNITSKPSNIMFYEGFTLDANTMSTNSTGFTYANNAPATGPIARFSANGSYDMWLNAPYSGGGSTLYFRTRNGDTSSYNSWQALASYGINYASTLYATTYYDSNDTGYYLDPASTSVLNVVNLLAGKWYPVNNASGNSAEIYVRPDNNNTYVWRHIYGGTGTGYGTGVGGYGIYAQHLGGDYSLLFNAAGYVTASYSLRSPIFYDNSDTGYYIDPASTSNSALRMRGGALFGPNTTWGEYLYVGTNGNVGGSATVCTTDGNIHIDASNSSHGIYLGYYTGDFTRIYNSTRSPIFYDINDTGYYVDPASISNLVTVNTQNAVSNITGGLRNVMPGGGAYTTGASTVSGAIVVRLPTNLYPMIRFTVKVYTYDGLSFDINCGGHTSGGTWYNTFAWMATQHRSAMNVRFTYDGTYVYVYIGDLGSSWSYPQVFITDVQVGYSVTDYSYWDDGWSISFNTSTYNSISATHTVYPPTSTGNNTNPAYASIYYDADNTSYYVNPASGSNLSSVYTDNWFRTYGVTGLYSQSYGQHFYPYASSGYWNITGAGQAYGGLAFRGNYEAAIKGWIYWDSDGFGFLCPDNSWGVRVTDTTTYLFHDTYAKTITNYNNTAYYLDTPGTSVMNNVQITTLGVGTAASGTTGEIRATNNVTAYYSSDIKFKTNVRDIPNAIETVESIGGKLFDWNDEYIEEHGGEDGYFIQKEDFGVIAQDVLKVFPVAVRTRPDGSLAVDYEKLSALAFAAVSELSTRVKSLEARI